MQQQTESLYREPDPRRKNDAEKKTLSERCEIDREEEKRTR